jgi:hypothetical protein
MKIAVSIAIDKFVQILTATDEFVFGSSSSLFFDNFLSSLSLISSTPYSYKLKNDITKNKII